MVVRLRVIPESAHPASPIAAWAALMPLKRSTWSAQASCRFETFGRLLFGHLFAVFTLVAWIV
jgi:hypothetical protein